MICTSIHCDSGLIGAFGLLTFTCDSETTCSRDMLSESGLMVEFGIEHFNHIVLCQPCPFERMQPQTNKKNWTELKDCCKMLPLWFVFLESSLPQSKHKTYHNFFDPKSVKKKIVVGVLVLVLILVGQKPKLVLFFSVEIASSSAAWIGQEEFFHLCRHIMPTEVSIDFFSRWRILCPTHFRKMSISRLLLPHLARGLFLKNSAMRLHGRFFSWEVVPAWKLAVCVWPRISLFPEALLESEK